MHYFRYVIGNSEFIDILTHFWSKKNTVSSGHFEYYLLLLIKGPFCTFNIRVPLLLPLPV